MGDPTKIDDGATIKLRPPVGSHGGGLVGWTMEGDFNGTIDEKGIVRATRLMVS